MIKKYILISLAFLLLIFSACGKREWENPFDIDSDKSSWAPNNLNILRITLNSIKLTWKDNCNLEDGYKIDKKVGFLNWQISYDSVNNDIEEWIDENVEINVIIQYRVYAYCGENQSSYIETEPIDNTIPAPENLTYELNENQVTLYWEYEILGIDSFIISKKVVENNWDYNYASVESTLLEWTDYDIESDEFYTYKIRAKYENYYSAHSNEVVINLHVPENMVYVQGGTFMMGSNNGNQDEQPIHQVTISSFFIGKHEVTQEEYEDIMENNPAHNYGIGDNYPVYYVSWYDAVEFCNAKSIAEGLTPCYTIDGVNTTCDFNANGYRLPTEAEWEFAAQGGNLSEGYTYSGSNNPDDVAWYSSNSGGSTHHVGEKDPNELGIYDMTGNLWEWCWDWYSSSYYQECYNQGNVNDPTGPDSGTHRLLRGGSWFSIDSLCRVSDRYPHNTPDDGVNRAPGFRFSRIP